MVSNYKIIDIKVKNKRWKVRIIYVELTCYKVLSLIGRHKHRLSRIPVLFIYYYYYYFFNFLPILISLYSLTSLFPTRATLSLGSNKSVAQIHLIILFIPFFPHIWHIPPSHGIPVLKYSINLILNIPLVACYKFCYIELCLSLTSV